MAKNFRTARKFRGPRWLVGDGTVTSTDDEETLLGYALDLVKDQFVQRVREGYHARLPQQDAEGTPSPDDALTALGRDRRVVRGINETARAYAYRLTQWLVDRRTAGNPFTLMKQLAAYCGAGTSFRTVDCRGNWYSRDAAGVETSLIKQGNWNWDGVVNRRFWVIIYPGSLWTAESAWGTGVWGETTGTWGTTVTPEQATTLRAIVSDWKPAGTRGDIILAFDASSFNPATPEPDGLWGKWYRYLVGTAVESRLNTARYSGA